ncbi:type VI secretion system tube protein Hcp [Herbaspirillum sp. ST 5-3]|uniref:Hcp family type VI secretion system effector n=1 Tax=Oxalobacteraceae TaxID=75682 RepID=UPI0010A35467|nr:type VI secretion system tube protein Hcp [Herbaspirillum sp. ST 5-3]
MAIDAYMQIEGIKGESSDSKHKDWIEIFAVNWNVHQPRSSSVSTAGGHTNGKAELSEVSFKKLADLASPVLFQTCAMGKTIPKVKFEFMRADGNGEPIKYFILELENVMISTVSPNSNDGGILTERVSLAYSKIKSTYTKQSVRGGSEGNTSGGWDAAANKPV